MKISREPFGALRDGRSVERYWLTNHQGMEAAILTYGGIWQSFRIPTPNEPVDVVLGLDSLEAYEAGHPYFGTITGRYANRIANGQFKLDGKTYGLVTNNGSNHLHGGEDGFDKKIWKARTTENERGPLLQLRYQSRDGEEGYPGTMDVLVSYQLTDSGELHLVYEAKTDAETVLCLTNHAYFNLKGEGQGTILDHELRVLAEGYLPVDETSIPIGQIAPVAGSPFDFQEPLRLGERIEDEHEQLRFGNGYDHNWILWNETPPSEPQLAAVLSSEESGIALEVLTTEPGLQVYTGNFLDGSLTGKSGTNYQKRDGICLETQHFPNSPNEPDFPSVRLRPGETYRQETIFRFHTK